MEQEFLNIREDKSVIFPTLVIEIFYLLYFCKMIVGSETNLSNILDSFMVMLGVLSLIYISAFKKIKRKSLFLGFISIFIMSGMLSALYTSNYGFNDFLLMFQYLGVGLLLCKYKLNFKLTNFSFLMYASYFIIQILLGTHPDNLFNGFSRNAVSIFIIIQIILLYISTFQWKKNLTIFPTLINLVLSIWSIGRSGIITSVVLFLIILSLKHKERGLKTIFTYIGIFTVLTISFLYFYETIFESAIERTVVMGMTDSSRESINSAYITNASNSLGNLFFGVSINEVSVFSLFSYNLHNAYLKLHSFHGLLGFSLILFQVVNSGFQFLKNKNLLYLGLMVVILLRITTDIAAFHGPFDPLIIYFLYTGIIYKQKVL